MTKVKTSEEIQNEIDALKDKKKEALKKEAEKKAELQGKLEKKVRDIYEDVTTPLVKQYFAYDYEDGDRELISYILRDGGDELATELHYWSFENEIDTAISDAKERFQANKEHVEVLEKFRKRMLKEFC